MRKPLTYTLYVGGKQVETFTEEQRERIAQRLSKAMSVYYSAHPEEYKKLLFTSNEKYAPKQL